MALLTHILLHIWCLSFSVKNTNTCTTSSTATLTPTIATSESSMTTTSNIISDTTPTSETTPTVSETTPSTTTTATSTTTSATTTPLITTATSTTTTPVTTTPSTSLSSTTPTTDLTSTSPIFTSTNTVTAEAPTAVSTTTIAIATGAAVGFVALVILIIFLVVVWRRRLYCFKRSDDGHKASDGEVNATRDNREAYDMWDLNQQPAVLVGTVNAGFDPEALETVPGMKDERAQKLSTESGSHRARGEAEVYAKVNKHKHPERHEYTNVAQNTFLTTHIEQVLTTPRLVKAKEHGVNKDSSDTKANTPTFTKAGREESSLNKEEEGRGSGEREETAGKARTADVEGEHNSQSDNRKYKHTNKTPLLPKDTTLLNSVARKGYQVLPNVDNDDGIHGDAGNQAETKAGGKQVKLGPPVPKKPQFTVKPLATGNLKRPVLPADHNQPHLMSLAVGDLKATKQNEENDKRERGVTHKIALLPPKQGPLKTDAKATNLQEKTDQSQPGKTDQLQPGKTDQSQPGKAPELDVNGHNSINVTKPCNEENPESKVSETSTIDRVSGIINEEGNFYFILDKEPGDSADHFNENEEPPSELPAPEQRDTGDQSRDSTYYSTPGQSTANTKNVARQESSTYESIDDDHTKINAQAKRRNQDFYCNIPEPLKKKAAASSETDSTNHSVAKQITAYSNATLAAKGEVATSSSYYSLAVVIPADPKKVKADVAGSGDYNKLSFEGRDENSAGMVQDEGAGGEQVYSHLNQGEDDDMYSHTDRGIRKVEIIDDEYSHIK